MTTRVRELVGPAGRPCALCSGHRVVLVRSWDRPNAVERLAARLGRGLATNERFTDECRDCGSRAFVRSTPTSGLRTGPTSTRPATG